MRTVFRRGRRCKVVFLTVFTQKRTLRTEMKILFLTSWFPSRVHPTNGNFVARHARLVAQDHEVTVVAVEVDEHLPLGALDLTHRTENGYNVLHAYTGYGPKTPAPAKIALRMRAYARAMRAARHAFGPPDLIHAHVLLDGGMVAAQYANNWARPFVLTEHNSVYLKAGALSGLRKWLGAYACRKAKFIMPVSEQVGLGMQTQNGLAGNYRPLSNVVDEQLYCLRTPPQGPPFRLLHVSNFEEEAKNISGLLRAFTNLPQAPNASISLLIAGDGDLETLQAMIRATGADNISCSGPHTEAEVAELMQNCHAFVLFSNYENQPVVLLEAQMSGRPCIATPVGGIPDIVLPGETGLLVPVADEAALTQAITNLRHNYEHFDQEKIRQRAIGRYSETAVRAALNEVYAVAVGNSGAAS